jgi:hypothetical protein
MSDSTEQEGGGPQSEHVSREAKRERLKLVAFTFTRSPAGQSLVQVELEFEGKRFVGRSQGSSSPLADLRIGADAALQALRGFAADGLGLELIGVKLVHAFDTNVAIVSITRRAVKAAPLVGCCLADREPVRAAALSVLNATNRLIENYIAASRAKHPVSSPLTQ